MSIEPSTTTHQILLFVIALVFICDGCWQVLKGSTSLVRRYHNEKRANEPATSVSWFQIVLGLTMLTAGCVLLFSAFASL